MNKTDQQIEQTYIYAGRFISRNFKLKNENETKEINQKIYYRET